MKCQFNASNFKFSFEYSFVNKNRPGTEICNEKCFYGG